MELLTTKKIPAAQDYIEKENAFYEKKLYFSYSSLNKLIWNPRAFYTHYIIGQKEDKTDKHFIEGKMIHALLLSEADFDKHFLILPGKMPGENIRQVINRIHQIYLSQTKIYRESTRQDLSEYKPEILGILKEIDLHQSLKNEGDEKRVQKVCTLDGLNYWNYLKRKGVRDIADQPTVENCRKLVKKIQNTPSIMKLMGKNYENGSDISVINERFFKYDLKNYPFGIKGIIDNYTVDHTNKVIRINDIKTSSKDLDDFKESVEIYKYWMQAVIYVTLVIRYYKELIENGYSVEFNFIVIDKNQHIYPFAVTKATMETWTNRFNNEILFKANYHYTQRQFSLPYEFAEGLVVL